MTDPDPTTTIVVPTWRGDDQRFQGSLAALAAAGDGTGVDVVVAAPSDETSRHERLRTAYPQVRWVCAPRGRASQMNAGAAVARGEWLVFLHADSRLPDAWSSVIRRAARDERIVGGSYRLRLDSSDWRARVIEAGVRARVRCLGLPYGDQALFVRQDVFNALGGYRDLPLMEDVDLVRRLSRLGALLHSELPVETSSRAWERDGWITRSAQNVCLATLYFCGVSPAALARVYFRRRPIALAMMARAPWMPGKTRLASRLAPVDHAALKMALFRDTLEVIRSIDDADRYVLCEAAEACEALRDVVGHDIEVLAQHAGDLGQRLRGAFEDLFRLGAHGAIVIGSDLPSLPRRLIFAATAALKPRGDRVVLGPAADGGYYLVALKSSHPELFADIEWGTANVLQQTLSRARQHGLEAQVLEPWYDIDDWKDLERLGAEPGDRAPVTRAWLALAANARGQGHRDDRIAGARRREEGLSSVSKP